MVLRIDTSRALLGEADFVALVRAVVGGGEGDEGHWIEWKSTLDLGSAEGKAAVVRCVLGMANRQPDVAARFCEGRGYVVVGAEPGGLVGVAPADPADLTAWWGPFLGSDGPRWEPHWLVVDGRDVLVVEVAAPRTGDPVRAARRSTTGVADGDVFVRRHGRTERASSVELAGLVARAGGAPSLTGLSVTVLSPGGPRPVAFGPAEMDRWVGGQRDGCLESLSRAQRPPAGLVSFGPGGAGAGASAARVIELQNKARAGGLTDEEQAELDGARAQAGQAAAALSQAVAGIGGSLWSTEPETRSAEQYRAQVDAYADELRRALPAELRAAASAVLAPCVLALRNETEANVPEARLVVHVPGELAGASEPDAPGQGLSAPPRPFGPRRVNRLNLGAAPFDLGALSRSLSGGVFRSGVDIDNGGSAVLTFDPVHLRPFETVPLSPVVLLLPVR